MRTAYHKLTLHYWMQVTAIGQNRISHRHRKDDLFTLDRSKMPIAQRLKLDEKERTCVKNCSAKWDETFRREAQRLMRTEQDLHTMDMMMKMQDHYPVSMRHLSLKH